MTLASLFTATAWAASPPGTPASFGVADRDTIMVVHAEGAQIYECKSDPAGKLAWAFREPIAALMSGGKTIGRHYLGPTWELTDGGTVKGKLAATVPGATPEDVALLKLDVIEHHGAGALKDASLVLRLNSHGGNLAGACTTLGELHGVAYSADYAFLR